MDKLILSLEKLIKKKKAIKKTLLQKMFPDEGETTPELRLPGFTEAWEQRKLGECVTITSGEAPSKFKHGSVNYVKVDDLNYTYKTVVDTQNKVSDNPSMSKVKVGSVIFPKRGAAILTNKVRILGVESYMDTNMMALTATSLDSDFLYVLISKEGLYKIADTSTIPQINNKHIEPYEVIVPTLDEQKRIGELFAHLDTLITLHQRKLEKCRKIKQGMMQKLLTGDIRLSKDSIEDKSSIKNKTISVSDAKEHNQPFDDAVVISGIVDCFYSPDYRLGRKKVQKLLYLLRRHQEADISSFKKKAAGPYSDEIRYKGGEPIAVHNGYIVTTKNNKGTLFTKGEKITDALEYLRKWNQDGDLQWLVRQFKYITTDNLELLATIDMAMCDLETEHIEITIENLKKFIKSNKEWKNKLSKSYFSEEKIKWAIEECNRLFR